MSNENKTGLIDYRSKTNTQAKGLQKSQAQAQTPLKTQAEKLPIRGACDLQQ
jgi:hypothetical protein